ncbi:hypothetical protein ACFX1S_046340 [Malus domestica]
MEVLNLVQMSMDSTSHPWNSSIGGRFLFSYQLGRCCSHYLSPKGYDNLFFCLMLCNPVHFPSYLPLFVSENHWDIHFYSSGVLDYNGVLFIMVKLQQSIVELFFHVTMGPFFLFSDGYMQWRS